MQLRHLRYFVAVAEEENFRRAAHRLNLTQPAVSRQIQDLESELGVKLFERTHQRIRLSEPGRLYFHEAKRILADLENAGRMALLANQGEAGTLHIAFNSVAARHNIVPASFHRFRMQYPHVELKLSYLTSTRQLEELRAATIDAGFLMNRPQSSPVDFKSTKIASDDYILAMPNKHPLASRRHIRLSELTQAPFIVSPRASSPAMHDTFIAACMSSGFSPNIVQEVENEQTMLSFIAMGMGISIVHSSARQSLPSGVLLKKVGGLSIPSNLELVWQANNRSSILKRFVELVNSLYPSHRKVAAKP